MAEIFKWFFGIIITIILVYVLIVVIKYMINFGSSTLSNISTASTTATSSTSTWKGFTLQSWVLNFHPFQYAPVNIVPSETYDNSGFGHTSVGSYPTSSYVQGLLQQMDRSTTDFDRRWGGGAYGFSDYSNPGNQVGYYGSENVVVSDEVNQVNNGEYFKINIDPRIPVINYQVIGGMANASAFIDKYFIIYILDANKQIIGKVKAFSNGDYKNGYIPFRAVLTFNQPQTTNGYLVLKNENEASVDFNQTTILPIIFQNVGHLRQMPPMLYKTPEW